MLVQIFGANYFKNTHFGNIIVTFTGEHREDAVDGFIRTITHVGIPTRLCVSRTSSLSRRRLIKVKLYPSQDAHLEDIGRKGAF